MAVPYIAGSVSATNDQATWVLTSYLVANAVFLPSSARFSLRFGCKRYLMFSVLVFTIASFACGIANSLGFILLRNLGGSIGIAVANTIALRHLQTHRNGLLHWSSRDRPEFRNATDRYTTLMLMHAGPAKAALVNGELNRQAQAWAYIDVLRYLALACAVCIPVVFVLKKCRHGAHAHVTC